MGNLLEIDNLISVDNNLNKISEKIQKGERLDFQDGLTCLTHQIFIHLGN